MVLVTRYAFYIKALKAFQFLVLTATRTSEAINATWSEIDLAEAVWRIPAERMKAAREHRIPLSRDALAILGSGDLQPSRALKAQ